MGNMMAAIIRVIGLCLIVASSIKVVSYLIVWNKDKIVLHLEIMAAGLLLLFFGCGMMKIVG